MQTVEGSVKVQAVERSVEVPAAIGHVELQNVRSFGTNTPRLGRTRPHPRPHAATLSTACDHSLGHTGRSSLLRSWRSSLRLRVLQWTPSPHSGEAKSWVQRRPHGVPVSGTAAKTMISQVWNFRRSLLWLYTSSQVLTATCTSETRHATTLSTVRDHNRLHHRTRARYTAHRIQY